MDRSNDINPFEFIETYEYSVSDRSIYLVSFWVSPHMEESQCLSNSRRGKVGLTMGPFSGNWTAFHTITAVRKMVSSPITDRVRVARDHGEDHSSVICCCGLCDVMQQYVSVLVFFVQLRIARRRTTPRPPTPPPSPRIPDRRIPVSPTSHPPAPP
jgi:hypothetical protein